MIRTLVIASVLFAGVSLAQTGQTGTGQTGGDGQNGSTNGQVQSPPPPPLVDAPVQKQQDAPVNNQNVPPTPPPPGAHYPGAQGQSGYQYSPYGAPINQNAEIPKEYGLMATEFLFGALTAAPIVILPYFLGVLSTGSGLPPEAQTLNTVLFFLVFTGVPVAVAQTQIGLANGSRYYYSDSWPAYLSGLAAEGAVVGLYYLLGSGTSAGLGVLMVGSIAFVPLIETVAINFLKTPRSQLPNGGFGLIQRGSNGEWAVSRPTLAPLFTRASDGLHVGVQLPVLSGSF